MRLRLQTSNADGSKLPQLKVWFAFSAADKETPQKSITDLKKSICTTIKSFSNANIIFRDIALGLDGFELLDELSAEEVLRDGDLLVIKRRETYTGQGKKRKAEDDGWTTAGKRPRPLQSKTRPRNDSSVSSSSSESDPSSSESDSTTDDTGSSTDSSSSSDSDSSTHPSNTSLKPKPPKSANIKAAPPIQQTHVPPGLGSVKTRKRNIRRRCKKKHDAFGGQGAEVSTLVPSPPKRISGVNVAPLGSRAKNSVSARAQQSTDNVLIHDPLNLTMFSLGNKNKKKGYKYALAPPTSQKKVFSVPDSSDVLQEVEEESDVLNGPLPSSTTIFTSAPENPLARQARVIPPSELQSLGKLPKNMFVTSVDVEEDLWNNSSSKKRKKKKKKQQLEHWEEDYTDTVREKPCDDEMPSTLDYGLAEEHLSYSNSEIALAVNDLDAEDSKSMLIWSVVEQNFEAFPQVSLDSLQNGKLVAWKALALNLETYSPELLLHIATVIAVSNDSSGGNSSFSIRRLIRPGWEELDVENIQGDYAWESVEQMGWRAVNEIQRTSLNASSSTSVDTAIASATATGAGSLQAGIIQAAATQETTTASTDADAKTLSAISSISSASETSSSSVSQTTITTSTKATSTTSSSTSSSTSAKVSSVSTTSASSGTSTSTSSFSVSQSKASTTTSASVSSSASPIAQSVQATQTPSSTATGSAAVEIVSTGTVDGHLTTLTTQVFAATSSSGQPTPTQLDSTETFSITGKSHSFAARWSYLLVDDQIALWDYELSISFALPSALRMSQLIANVSAVYRFFKNKAAVGGVFGAAGLIFLIVLLAVVLKIVRYRSRRKFEKDLDEQVQQEVRSGTPMFGLGKEDDGLSIMGGRAGVISDPEKAAYADSGYGYPNTAALYPSYGGSALPQAAQPAYYSPNVYSSRRNPSRGQSQDFNYRDGGLSRVDSRGSARSYGTLNQPPMNAFGPSQSISAGANAPAFAPATFAAHYGEYRHASPAPSTQSWQSHNQAFGARPGTPSALTPGGRGNSIPAPPRNVYTPQDVRSDSPAVLARYSPSHSSRTSGDGYAADAYIAGRITQIQTQNVGGLAVGPAYGKEPPSPNVPLPNPFDQKDR
ncbi:hypothetical protein C8J55DRAFT_566681 [Lentinula edodes]|uniref:Coilin n=1 Tax=Lentinula lateritia TaxID=40482 RepID=A0A9W8ZSW0_9AGAR|nr:hypothetical protein C8J55DRAFT_566681 [Lentinula edodes]